MRRSTYLSVSFAVMAVGTMVGVRQGRTQAPTAPVTAVSSPVTESMADMVPAPWTDAQTASLDRFQKKHKVYRCTREYGFPLTWYPLHEELMPKGVTPDPYVKPFSASPPLAVTKTGMKCVNAGCSFSQETAHRWALEGWESGAMFPIPGDTPL